MQADLKAFAAHGVHGVCAVTAIVAEVPGAVTRIDAVDVILLNAQLQGLAHAFPLSAMKTGMLANEALVAGCPLVIVPFGAEQIANGQRVEHLGAGAMVRAHELTDAKLDRALSVALSDAVRSTTRALADSLPTGDGAPRVADAIERLCAQ